MRHHPVLVFEVLIWLHFKNHLEMHIGFRILWRILKYLQINATLQGVKQKQSTTEVTWCIVLSFMCEYCPALQNL
jgi:hypothetical protein